MVLKLGLALRIFLLYAVMSSTLLLCKQKPPMIPNRLLPDTCNKIFEIEKTKKLIILLFYFY